MRKYDARIDKITLIGLEQLKQLKHVPNQQPLQLTIT